MAKKILIVEDEPDIKDLLKSRLEANGYEVMTATDGFEALEIARENKPDLITLDVMLPKLNGYAVCRMLKFSQQHQNIPIIMLTARSDPQDLKTGREVAADAYITKPFESQALIQKIAELLKKFEQNPPQRSIS